MDALKFVDSARQLNRVFAIHYSFVFAFTMSIIAIVYGNVDYKWVCAAWYGILQLVLGYIMGSKSKVQTEEIKNGTQ